MVKKKHTPRRPSHSPTGKTRTSVSRIADSKDPSHLTPLDDPAHAAAPAAAAPPELQTSGQGQPGFPDRVYLLASAIFQNNHLQKPAAHQLVNYGRERGVPLPEVRDAEMKRAAYELAFNTLKYQELLEDIMIDSYLYLSQSIPDDEMGLVAILLYDLQDRKFLPREPHEEEDIVQEVRDIENYLLRCKTQLAASLARCRIKHNLLSIECILPQSVKMKQERSSGLPLYAWINTLNSSLDEVRSVLRSSGFLQVKSIGQLEGQTFCKDPHCQDVLVFPAQLKARLYSTRLLSDHKLIIQDKSCSLGPNAVSSALPDDGDVLMVGCFSGLTVSHTASLITDTHDANSSNQPTVYVCVGDGADAQREELRQVVSDMGCKNVKLIPEVFQSLDGADKRLQRVRAILLTPRCSVSAVSNPVDYILQENGDTDLLKGLSQGSIAQSKLAALVAQQREDIVHALKFPKVLAVVYTTCSSYPEENEELVSRALEQTKAHSEQAGEAKQADFRLSLSPFSSPDTADGPEETDSFFMLEPSEQSNGCFLALLTREPEPVVKEAPHEVLARANAKGLLDRIGSDQSTRKERHGRTGRMTKAVRARTYQPRLPVSIRSTKNQQDPAGHVSTAVCGRQSSQGKPKALSFKASKNTTSSSLSSSSFKQESSCSSSSKQESSCSSSSKQESSCCSSSKQESSCSSSSKQESSCSSSSKQESSCSSSSKPENSTFTKRVAVTFDAATSPRTPHPALRPATPLVRPRKAPQEVLKPVVLVLPPVHFPNFQTGFSPNFSYNKWRTPVQALPFSRSGGGLPKNIVKKSRPLL
nr:putative methyltransferase NSUN7 isoform X1 [Solea senegalensis]